MAGWKRAVTVSGHRTSVSLDPMFWDLLATWAQTKGVSRNALIAEIDEQRGQASLSSAVRTAILAAVRAGVIESGPQAGS